MTARRRAARAPLLAAWVVVLSACTDGGSSRPIPHVPTPGPGPLATAPRPAQGVPLIAPGLIASSSGRLAIDAERLYFPVELALTRPAGGERMIVGSFEHDAPSALRAQGKAGGDAPVDLVRWSSRFGPDVVSEGGDVIFSKVGAFVPNPDGCRPDTLCSRPRFVVSATGAIASVSKNGGSERVLVSGVTGLERLAADAAHVFFADGEVIGRVARAGGPPEILARGVACNAIAVAAADLICGTRQGILRVAKAGGEGAVISAVPVHNHGLTVVGEVVVFGGAGVRRRATPLPPRSNSDQPQGIGNEPDPWVEETRFVAAVPVAGGPSRALTETSHIAFMAHDASSIVWDSSGTIERVPFAGGAPSVVAKTGALAVGIAADATHVYWLDSRGRLGRAPQR
jgi:hypothetical protein